MYSNDPKAKGPLHWYILHQNFVEACISGDVDAVDDAIRKVGLDVNQGKGTDRNPLAAAVCSGQPEVVKYLLTAGADVNTRYKGNTVLYLAFYHGYEEIIDLLVNAGADVTLLDESTGQLSIVDAAVYSGREKLVDFALSLAQLAGMDMKRLHAEGLISAVSSNDLHLAKKFLDKGVNPDDTGPEGCFGCPALVMAADRKNAGMVRLLVSYGAKAGLHFSTVMDLLKAGRA